MCFQLVDHRDVVATKPVSVTYTITAMGRELIETLRMLMTWSERRIGAVLTARRAFDAREAGIA